MQRRAFIKRALLGSSVVLLGGGTFLALQSGKTTTPKQALLTLSPAAFSVLVAVAARVLDGTNGNVEIVPYKVDDALRQTSPEARRDFGRVLLLLENGLVGALTRHKTAPFTTLSPEEQDQALYTWRNSAVPELRGAYNAMRKLCIGAFYSAPENNAGVGYAGPLLQKPDPKPPVANQALSAPFDAAQYPDFVPAIPTNAPAPSATVENVP